jgi:hypothetical protein
MIAIGVLLAAALLPFAEAQNQTCVSWLTTRFIRYANWSGAVYDSFRRPFERSDPLSRAG